MYLKEYFRFIYHSQPINSTCKLVTIFKSAVYKEVEKGGTSFGELTLAIDLNIKYFFMKEHLSAGTQTAIVPLSQELDKIFKSFLSKTNHILSDFSKESANPILMPDKSSFVLDLSTEEVINIFNVKHHHFFPTPDHIARIGLTADLSFYNLLALILKAMWENYLYSQVKSDPDLPLPYLEIILNEEFINQYNSAFHPETADLFNLLETYDHLAMIHGESVASLEITIRELLLNKYHLLDNQLVNKFAKRMVEEKEEKKDQDEDLKEEFDRHKMIFIRNHQTIETLLFDQLRISKEIENIKTRYYRRFPLKNEFLTLLFERDLLKIKIQIKKENPELSENELNARTEQVKDEFNKKLISIQTAMRRAMYVRRSLGEPIDSMKEADYRNQVRQALRTAFLLLHPDMIEKSVAEKLTEFQRTQLKQLWIELMELKDTFNYDESMLFYEMPDLGEIERIIEKTKSILKNFGDIEINPEYLIRGDTFSEKIEFLKNQNKILDGHIISLQIRIQDLLNDEEFQLYSNILSSFNKNIDKHEQDLKNGIESFRVQIVKLKNQLMEFFNS